jgi:hypothetical protein
MARHSLRFALSCIGAACLMTSIATIASARNLRVSEQRFRTTWQELRFKSPSGEVFATCPVTLEGSFHYSSIAKRALALVGFVTRAAVANESCREGHATVLTESLPWHVTYEGFLGTLPAIRAAIILLVGATFNSELFGFRCLITTTTSNPAVFGMDVGAGGTIVEWNFEPTPTIPSRSGGGFGCPVERLRIEGRGNPFILGSFLTRITLTLI